MPASKYKSVIEKAVNILIMNDAYYVRHYAWHAERPRADGIWRPSMAAAMGGGP